MFVSERCSRAAAASSSCLKRGATRKLTETFFPSDTGCPVQCIEVYHTCVGLFRVVKRVAIRETYITHERMALRPCAAVEA